MDLANQLPMVSSVMHQYHGNQPLCFLLSSSYHQIKSLLSDVLDVLLHSRPFSRDTLRKASALCLHLCFISKSDLASFNCPSYNTFHTSSPSHCSCSHPFSVEHALSCKTGGFPAVRHNEVRDITASLLTEVCHGVSTEPHLQSLSGESMSHRSVNTEVGARLDVAMYGFWGSRFEKAFLDVRVFNPSAQSNRHGSLAAVYRRHELEKKRQYEQWVRDIERATFTPLVMSTTGGMGKAASTFYKRLASMLSEKRDVSYGKTMNWIRCRLSFALLRASIMSIRGARSSRRHPATEGTLGPIDLQLAEGRIY